MFFYKLQGQVERLFTESGFGVIPISGMVTISMAADDKYIKAMNLPWAQKVSNYNYR